jgi:hypothetical protein
MRKAGGYQSHTQNIPHPSKTEQLANYRTLQYKNIQHTRQCPSKKNQRKDVLQRCVCVCPPHPTPQ